MPRWPSGSARRSRPPRRSPSSPPFRPAPGCRPSAMPTPFRNSPSRRSPEPALRSAAGLEPLRRHFATRLLALAGVGIAAAATVVLFFPQCLAAPYAMLDPRLKTFLLSAITEAQPIWSMVKNNPAMAVSYYVTPLLGARPARLEDAARRPDGSRQSSCWRFLAAAIAVSIWQVRGSMFAIPLATIPLAAWVGEWRARVAAGGGSSATLKMALAWIVSLNVAWSASANAIAGALGAPLSPGAARHRDAGDAATTLPILRRWQRCRRPPCLRSPISARRSSTIRITACSPGPYHRNVAGDIAGAAGLHGQRGRGSRDRRGATASGWSCCAAATTRPPRCREWAPGGFIAALAARRGAGMAGAGARHGRQNRSKSIASASSPELRDTALLSGQAVYDASLAFMYKTGQIYLLRYVS